MKVLANTNLERRSPIKKTDQSYFDFLEIFISWVDP